MAVEIAKRDANNVPVLIAISSSTSQVRMLRVDESTGRLLVDVGTISVSASSASDGTTAAAVPASASYIGGNKAGNLTGLLIGSQTSANSLAVVIASDQASIPIAGAKTNNNAAPGATNIGSLGMIANASAPTWVEGNMVLGSVDLAGNMRTLRSDQFTNGNLTGTGSITLTPLHGAGATMIQISGTWVGTVVFEGSIDGTNFFNLSAMPVPDASVNGNPAASATANGRWQFNTAGLITIRARCSVFTSGTISIFLRASAGSAQNFHFDSTGLIDMYTVGSAGVKIQQNSADGYGLLVGGGIAHDAADAGNPIKIGYYATSTNRTRVSSADRTDAIADLAGRQIVNLGHVRELRGKQTTTIAASTSETTIVTAGGAGVFNDLAALIISNTSATAARVDIRDDTAGTILFSLYIPAGDTRGFSVAGYSIPQTATNKNWTAQSSASITDLRILAIFEKNI